MTNQRVQLEICVGSVADAVAAAEADADRLELCSALCLGGLTPSYGTIAEARRCVDVPTMVMIRPRESGFCYDEREFNVMCRDAQTAIDLGADGIVFGVLRADGEIDEPRCRRLVQLAPGRQTVFHRAFDLLRSPLVALEQLIDLGFTRILTSGQQPSAIEGAGLIRQLLEQARARIEILPGGGLNETNVMECVRLTCCDQVHMGLSMHRSDPSFPRETAVSFLSLDQAREHSYRGVDPQRVRAVVHSLRASGTGRNPE